MLRGPPEYLETSSYFTLKVVNRFDFQFVDDYTQALEFLH
jgi:hypothetical protein